jgi:hypothetical protein
MGVYGYKGLVEVNIIDNLSIEFRSNTISYQVIDIPVLYHMRIHDRDLIDSITRQTNRQTPLLIEPLPTRGVTN